MQMTMVVILMLIVLTKKKKQVDGYNKSLVEPEPTVLVTSPILVAIAVRTAIEAPIAVGDTNH